MLTLKSASKEGRRYSTRTKRFELTGTGEGLGIYFEGDVQTKDIARVLPISAALMGKYGRITFAWVSYIIRTGRGFITLGAEKTSEIFSGVLPAGTKMKIQDNRWMLESTKRIPGTLKEISID